MRIAFLLVAFFCGMVSFGVASDQVRQASSSRFANVSGIVHPDELGQASTDPAVRERQRRELADDDDVTCYTVQSYLVKRRSRNSDAVEPVGYSTCVAASKYGVKVTGESDKGR